jgi:RNA polymerase-interacting CarD/CdnL/TRCF family regulator
MSSDLETFEVGDWIVHNWYGVGEIRKVEERPIHGEELNCYRVETKDAIYWLPVENADNDRTRRVVNKSRFQKALRALKAKPEKMAKNYRTRNAHIKEVVFESGSLIKMAGLLRDLLALRKSKKLNNTEKGAVERIRERMVREWSACKDIPVEEARTKLQTIVVNNFDAS